MRILHFFILVLLTWASMAHAMPAIDKCAKSLTQVEAKFNYAQENPFVIFKYSDWEKDFLVWVDSFENPKQALAEVKRNYGLWTNEEFKRHIKLLLLQRLSYENFLGANFRADSLPNYILDNDITSVPGFKIKVVNELYKNTNVSSAIFTLAAQVYFNTQTPSPDSSLGILSQHSNISSEWLEKAKSKSSPGSFRDFIDVLSHISIKLPYGTFSKVSIADDLNQPTNLKALTQTLQKLNYVFELSSNHPHTKQITANLLLKYKNLGALELKQLREEVRDLVARTLIEHFNDQSINLSLEELKILEDKWANLEPLIGYLSALNVKTPSMQKLRRKFVKLVKMDTKDEFHDFKFFAKGAKDKDRRLYEKQLKNVTSEQLTIWTQNKTLARVTFTEDIPSDQLEQIEESNITAQLQKILDEWKLHVPDSTSHLLEHLESTVALSEFIGNLSQAPLQAYKDYTNQLVQELNNKDLNLTVSQNQVANHLLYSEFKKSILILNDKTELVAKLKTVLGFYRSIRGHFETPETFDNQILALNDMLKTIKVKKEEKIQVLTTSSDLRFLLTIPGDIVSSSSCLCYTSFNSNVKGVLGWVMDANTKGLAGYNLEQSYFASNEDYKQVLNALKQGSVTTTFNGNNKTFTFHFSKGEKITTAEIPKGFFRAVIRIGKRTVGTQDNIGQTLTAIANQRIGLVTDQRFYTDHSLKTHKYIDDFIREIASDLNADLTGAIHFGPSRNKIGGNHTDYPYGDHIDRIVIEGKSN